MVKVSAQIPAALRSDLKELARANDRSVSAEVRRAIAQHVQASPTSEMIAPVSSESSLGRDSGEAR
jgi:predicted transcriptional regulator